jgi:hypothetical protein
VVAFEAAPLSDGTAWLPKSWKNPLRSGNPIPDRVRLDMKLVWSGWLEHGGVSSYAG